MLMLFITLITGYARSIGKYGFVNIFVTLSYEELPKIYIRDLRSVKMASDHFRTTITGDRRIWVDFTI